MKIVGPNGEKQIDVPGSAGLQLGNNEESVMFLDENVFYPYVVREGLNVWVAWEGYTAMFTLPTLDAVAAKTELRAPMTGRVASILVSKGDVVVVGQTVAVLEAMKMEYRLEAEIDGKVSEIGAEPGELVDLGRLLVRLE